MKMPTVEQIGFALGCAARIALRSVWWYVTTIYKGMRERPIEPVLRSPPAYPRALRDDDPWFPRLGGRHRKRDRLGRRIFKGLFDAIDF